MAAASQELQTFRTLISRGVNAARAALKAVGNDNQKALELLRQQWMTIQISYSTYLEAYLILS